MSLKRINFTSIPVDDQDRAIGFYTNALGFELQLDAPYEEGWRWVFLGIPGSDARIQLARRASFQVAEGTPILALVSDDVDADCVRWGSQGVQIHKGPDDAPWADGVRWALVRDSEGNLIFVESAKGGS